MAKKNILGGASSAFDEQGDNSDESQENPFALSMSDFNPHLDPKAFKPVSGEVSRLRERVAELEAQLTSAGGALAIRDGTDFVVGGYRLSSVGLVKETDTSEADVQALGIILFRLQDSLQWLIGDWLNEAQIYAWGDVEEIALQLKRNPRTLKNWKSTAASVPIQNRSADLEFKHHEAVQALDPSTQAAWLARAVQGDTAPDGETSIRWSVKRLRDEIAGRIIPALPDEKPTKTFKPMKRAFTAIWRAVQTQESPKKADILALKKWLIELEKSAK